LRAKGPPFSWVLDLRPEGPKLVLGLEALEIELDIRSSAQENASAYYEEAKKARRKAEGALRALEETRKRIKELEDKLSELGKLKVEVGVPPRPREETEKKAWYEAFRWFYSSDGLLVVAGKDARTNELLVKRYAGPGDLLLHAELPGAPFVLIKSSGREVPRETILEAAQMAISYSRAWKYGLGAATAICFKPEQAKKVGPHGEKLPKGTFYIVGKKEYIRGVRPELAVGVEFSRGKARVVVGPPGAIRHRAKAYVLMRPGDKDLRELVPEILDRLKAKIGPLELDKSEIERLRSSIPYGRGSIAQP